MGKLGGGESFRCQVAEQGLGAHFRRGGGVQSPRQVKISLRFARIMSHCQSD